MNSLIGIIILVLDIIAIVDVVRSSMTAGQKVLWVLGILIFPIIGMLLYFILKNRNPVRIVEGSVPPPQK